jgi:hypothetical protein
MVHRNRKQKLGFNPMRLCGRSQREKIETLYGHHQSFGNMVEVNVHFGRYMLSNPHKHEYSIKD